MVHGPCLVPATIAFYEIMTPERWQQIREVYFAVSDVEEQDRPALLAKLTAGDV